MQIYKILYFVKIVTFENISKISILLKSLIKYYYKNHKFCGIDFKKTNIFKRLDDNLLLS